MNTHLLSQLAHVEILSPRPEETVTFFEHQLGLEITTHVGQSTYLHGWGEFFHHSIKVTGSAQPGLGHIGWRADSAETLREAARLLEATGRSEGWRDGDQGHGPAYRFRSPDGHLHEVFWEVERWQASPEIQSTLRDRPQKYTGRGAAVRCLHHVTLNTSQIRACRGFYQQHLGFRYHDGTVLDGIDQELTAFLAVTGHHHDLGLIWDPAGVRGRLNHVAFYLETREEVMRAADVMRDYDKTIIEFGPGRHCGGGSFFLYLREPGGNRIELCTGEALILAPDWEPTRWLALRIQCCTGVARSPNRCTSTRPLPSKCHRRRNSLGQSRLPPKQDLSHERSVLAFVQAEHEQCGAKSLSRFVQPYSIRARK